MMWTRKDLKQRAKDALKRNYWKIVLVSVLSMTLGGGLSYSMSSSSGRSSVVVSDVVTVDEANDVDYDEECETGYDNEIYDEEGIVEESQGADKITDGGGPMRCHGIWMFGQNLRLSCLSWFWRWQSLRLYLHS